METMAADREQVVEWTQREADFKHEAEFHGQSNHVIRPTSCPGGKSYLLTRNSSLIRRVWIIDALAYLCP